MSTISVPLNAEQEAFIASYIKQGKAENKAQVVRRALTRLSEEEAVEAVLRAQEEPTLRGDIRTLMRKIK
jgi:Arc/MetJ-type ribon-helix-helix transcriptional regulator